MLIICVSVPETAHHLRFCSKKCSSFAFLFANHLQMSKIRTKTKILSSFRLFLLLVQIPAWNSEKRKRVQQALFLFFAEKMGFPPGFALSGRVAAFVLPHSPAPCSNPILESQKNEKECHRHSFCFSRRRWDLNPCTAINRLLPFQGSPFGQLGYFSELCVHTVRPYLICPKRTMGILHEKGLKIKCFRNFLEIVFL